MGILWSSIRRNNNEEPPPPDQNIWELLQPQQQQQQPSPTINWNWVIARLQDCPHEAAAYCHFREASPLQCALQQQQRHSNVPIAAVQAFLDAYPEAVLHSDQNRTTVLHAAAHLTNVDRDEIIQCLLKCIAQQEPQNPVLQVNARGQLPLHFVETASIATLLIGMAQSNESGRADGGVLHADADGHTPLDRLCQVIDEKQQQQDEPLHDELWKVLTVFVHTIRPHEPILHALVDLGCCPAAIQWALTKCPQQALQGDRHGRTPLLIAAANIGRQQQQQHSNDTSDGTVVGTDGGALQQQQHAIQTVCLLLHCAPDGARMTDPQGRLAIDIVAEAGVYQEHLINALIACEPRAVDTRDLRDKHFPFITAALSSTSNLNTVYKLLRTKPHVVEYFQRQAACPQQGGEGEKKETAANGASSRVAATEPQMATTST